MIPKDVKPKPVCVFLCVCVCWFWLCAWHQIDVRSAKNTEDKLLLSVALIAQKQVKKQHSNIVVSLTYCVKMGLAVMKRAFLNCIKSVKWVHVCSNSLHDEFQTFQKLIAKCELLSTSLPWNSRCAPLHACCIASESGIYVAQMQQEITEGYWTISYHKSTIITDRNTSV